MNASNRLMVNTMAQYSRTVVNMILSLYTTRLVLLILGESDYGLYALVGGVVALMSFLTNSLVVSTQRFLSVSIGKGDSGRVKVVFCSSLIVHLLLGTLVVILLELLSPLFFNGFLNIPEGRICAAQAIYHIVTAMLFLTFLTAPFRALLISHENITYISAIDVLDGVLKLALVLLMQYAEADKLIVYAAIMFGINVTNFLALSIYDYIRYEECVMPSYSLFSKGYTRELASFTGWILYSNFCIVGRNQGLAIVLNKLVGTVANAAYGIGNQIVGYISFVSSSFATAIGPQLMKAEGGNDHKRMLYLAKFQSKISYLLLAMVALPTVFEVQTLLELWLKDVPKDTSVFAIMALVGMLVDQPTQGLATTFHAIGRLRTYTLIDYTPKFLLLPLCWLLLHLGLPMWTVALGYILMELLCMLLRIPLMRKSIPFNVADYARYVFGGIAAPTIAGLLACAAITSILEFRGRFILTFCVGMAVCALFSYKYSLLPDERARMKALAQKAILKISRK